MTKDTWAIIGTVVTLGSIVVALGTIGINQNAHLNTRIGDLRDDMNARFTDLDGDVGRLSVELGDLRSDLRQVDGRLRAVEIEVGKVDQRLSTLERAIIPTAAPAEESGARLSVFDPERATAALRPRKTSSRRCRVLDTSSWRALTWEQIVDDDLLV